MSAYRPRLRGSRRTQRGPWPVGDLPKDAVVRIGSGLILVFQAAKKTFLEMILLICCHGVDGSHRDSPLGVVDVVKDDCGWSAKTVKTANDPHTQRLVRLISDDAVLITQWE